MSPTHDELPDDVRDVAETLHTHRPRLEPLELDRVKRRAMARRATPRKGAAMRSRLAITSMLVLGIVLSSGGAALGVSALSTSPSASAAQYGQPTVGPSGGPTRAGRPAPTLVGVGEAGPGGGITGAGGEERVPDFRGDTTGRDRAGVGPDEAGGAAPVTREAAVQASRQLGGDEEAELPFTGYAAIPTLLAGLLLLGSGLVLRRSNRRAES